ncbi:calcium-activated chloride channel regulator 1-like [Artemia franciscana]|uniref:calcium-activated chloride channel regulator 1-like n=1 Tax=Artemia franciscana TaxID=6661 RepID=UPI0032D9D17C
MSIIYKLLIIFGFLVYVAFCKKNKISIVNGGYKDVIISIADNVVVSDEENFIEQLKGLIGSASEKLNKATHNQVYFDEITISLPSNWSLGSNNTASSAITFENANIRVINAEESPLGGGPWTSHSGLCGMQGDYISMTKEFVEGNGQFVEIFGSKEKAFIHEWAHFRWGVFEEYGFPGDSRFPYFYFPPGRTEQVAVYSAKDDLDGVYQTIDGANCTTTEAGVYDADCRFFPNEDNATSVSLMSFHYLPSALEFDDTLYHRKAVPSKQNQLCNYESVWETMMKHGEDFPSSRTDTKPTTFKIVKRISSPVIFAIFDAGLSTNPDADIEVIKSHLLSASESFIGKHFGFATYSSATTIKFDVRLPITYLEDSFQSGSIVGSALNSVTQSTDTSSTFSYPIDKAIRIVSDYGAPAGAVVYVIGYAGNDYRFGFLEPHVISLASENGIKIISQESGILTPANQLQRISNLTNGAHFQFSGAFSTEELDANLEGILAEFESVRQNLRVVVSEAVIAVQESTLSFTLDALMTDELYFFVTGNRFGVGNLGTCSSKVADPTGVETDSIFQANWGREGNQNAILFSAVTASSGNWTVKTTCAATANFWVDVILKTNNIDSVQIKLWSSAVSPENVTPPLRIFAKPMIGQFNAGNLKLKAHIRDVNSVPMRPSQYFTINLGDDGFGDPDSFEDGIYSGILIPPSGSLSSGAYSVGIEVLSEESSWLIASGKKSISADQSQICCGSSFPTSSSVLPSGYRRYFPDLWTFTVSSFTAKFKPPKIIISSLIVENTAKSDLQVTMEWISPRGNATDDTAAVSSYEVRYSSRIETILEGDFAVVDEFTECSPVAPGNTQTCRFNISNFTEITAFFSVAAAVETEKGDFSPIVWSQPLRELSTPAPTETSSLEFTNTTPDYTTLTTKEPEIGTSPSENYCMDGWSLVCSSESDCSCFRYLLSYSSFDVAFEFCDALGGNLPSFHSEDKNNFIYVFQDDLNRGAWIGLKRKNCTFEWIDGSTLDFTSWNDGSPSYNTTSNDCVHFVGYEDEGFTTLFKWQDSPCSELRPILCEMPILIAALHNH